MMSLAGADLAWCFGGCPAYEDSERPIGQLMFPIREDAKGSELHRLTRGENVASFS